MSGSQPPFWSVAPFALLLACIAILPLVAAHFWDRHRNKALVSLVLSAPIAFWLLRTEPQALWHTLHEYASFLILLAALFVVGGGIHVGGDLRATPRNNVLLLAIGALLSNVLGTTGASMVMIRLILRTNSERKQVAHIPFFFILVVSNCGGMLTPLGDPPLFLGYLRGVPFTWTLRLAPIWLLTLGYVLTLFFFIDRRAYAKERPADIARDEREIVPTRVIGWRNVPLLGAIIAAVFLSSPLRELTMIAAAAASLRVGPVRARQANAFAFGPIVEVAILFAGIFVTMVPALKLLAAHGSSLGLAAPWQFFLLSGALSSVLDNAPTYLTFLSAAQSLGLPNDVVGVPHVFLVAISAGSVLMGANTYIGNGPNFMVKAIAESAGYETASFGRYALAAVAVLLPVYVFCVVYLWAGWPPG
jgi:Na+/H+ antiporter NhaD/arsenite permease-like protein